MNGKSLHSSVFLLWFNWLEEKNSVTHIGGGGGRLTSFSFLKYPLRLVPLRFPGLFVWIGLGSEISDTLIYRLWSWSLGAKNSHPVPSELRHDCFLQVGGFLFSSVHISIGSLEHHYLLSVYLFPKEKEEWSMLIKQQWIANQLQYWEYYTWLTSPIHCGWALKTIF